MCIYELKFMNCFHCLLILMLLYIMLVYFAIDLCIAIVYIYFLSPCFIFVLTHSLLIFINALHHVQFFVFNWFANYDIQTVFIYRRIMCSGEKTLKDKHHPHYCYSNSNYY